MRMNNTMDTETRKAIFRGAAPPRSMIGSIFRMATQEEMPEEWYTKYCAKLPEELQPE